MFSFCFWRDFNTEQRKTRCGPKPLKSQGNWRDFAWRSRKTRWEPFGRLRKVSAMSTAALSDLCERYRGLRLERPDEVARVQRSIERDGVLCPVVVNEVHEKLVVLDGFKRLTALRALGRSEVGVQVVRVDENQARASLLAYNKPHRGVSEIEEAWVVRSLVRECKLRQLDVAELLGRHKSWVTRRLQLAENLVAELQDDMRLGLLCSTVARELCRLPRGNQGCVSEAVKREGLTSRQCGALVEKVLACPDEPSLLVLLKDPLRFIDEVAAPPLPVTKDPRLGVGAEEVRVKLVRVDEACSSLCVSLRRHRPGSFQSEELSALFERAHRTQQRVEEAREELSSLLKASVDA